VVDVPLRVLPVDVVQREALEVAFDGLLEALAQAEQVVDLLVGPHQAVVEHVLQRLDGCMDISLAEGVLVALVTDRVDPPELLFQDPIQHDGRLAPAAKGERLGRREVLPAEVLQKLQGRHL